MDTFSALLAIREFLLQRQVTRSFDVFFDLRPNIQLSKLSRVWWFETPSCSLWRHCNANLMLKGDTWSVFCKTTSVSQCLLFEKKLPNSISICPQALKPSLYKAQNPKCHNISTDNKAARALSYVYIQNVIIISIIDSMINCFEYSLFLVLI